LTPLYPAPILKHNMKHFLASALEVAEVAIVAIGAVFIIRTFLIQPFLVSGVSMAPNFSNGDYLLVDELSYYLRSPERGEVVVFHFPQDDKVYFIKRVIGLPGEKVVFEGGKVVVYSAARPEGEVLDERYLPQSRETLVRSGGRTSFDLGEAEYLVLGDNRSYSYDSRDWGVLNEKEIVGLVRLRLWPVNDFRVYAAPYYAE